VKTPGHKKILIVRLGSMGDIIHSLPAAAALKRSFPEWRLDWLVEHRWRGLLEGNPCVDNVIVVDTLRWRRMPLSGASWSGARNVFERLRSADYDIALDLQAAIKSAVACVLSGARDILGFEKPWLKEPACSVLYTHRIAAHATHMVHVNLALAAACGAALLDVRFPLPTGDDSHLPRELDTQPFALINPGAGWRTKCWPAERYAAVCDFLEHELGLRTCLNCGPAEEMLAHQVQNSCRTANPVIYSGDLTGLIALARKSRLAIGPDTGPVHLAAALGIPTIALFGPTDPRRNGPYGSRVQVLRSPQAVTSYSHTAQDDEAMRGIQTSEVISVVGDLLREENGVVAGPAAAVRNTH
jgi:heptosyltransferase I